MLKIYICNSYVYYALVFFCYVRWHSLYEILVYHLQLPCNMSAVRLGFEIKDGCGCFSYSKVRFFAIETSKQTHSKYADQKGQKLSVF
jgi:hypothetical protein